MFSFIQCLDRVTAPIHIYETRARKIKPGCSLPPPVELLDSVHVRISKLCILADLRPMHFI